MATQRMLAIANILDGMDRETAARRAGMTRQTLRDWVLRYNESGLEGLYNKPKGHRKRALTPESEAGLRAMIEAGPPEGRSLVRWRCIDFQAYLEETFGIKIHERTVGKILKRLGFSYITGRPQHHKTDRVTQEAFKKNFLSG
jgi:transposase